MAVAFSDRLVRARKTRELTQTQVAAAACMAPSAIAHLEAGDRKPSYDSMLRLGQALRVSTDFLLGLTEEMSGHVPYLDNTHLLSAHDRNIVQTLIDTMLEKSNGETCEVEVDVEARINGGAL